MDVNHSLLQIVSQNEPENLETYPAHKYLITVWFITSKLGGFIMFNTDVAVQISLLVIKSDKKLLHYIMPKIGTKFILTYTQHFLPWA